MTAYIFLLIAFVMGFACCMFCYETGLMHVIPRDDPTASSNEDEE